MSGTLWLHELRAPIVEPHISSVLVKLAGRLAAIWIKLGLIIVVTLLRPKQLASEAAGEGDSR